MQLKKDTTYDIDIFTSLSISERNNYLINDSTLKILYEKNELSILNDIIAKSIFSPSSNTIFKYLIETNNIDILQKVIKRIVFASKNLYYLLYSKTNYETIKLAIIHNYYDNNSRNEKLMILFGCACRDNNIKLIKFMEKEKYIDEYFCSISSICKCIENNNNYAIKMLLELNAQTKIIISDKMPTKNDKVEILLPILDASIRKNNIEIFKLLLTDNKYIIALLSSGYSLLKIAIKYGNLEIVQLIINNKESQKQIIDYMPLIRYAFEYSEYNIMNLLMENNLKKNSNKFFENLELNEISDDDSDSYPNSILSDEDNF